MVNGSAEVNADKSIYETKVENGKERKKKQRIQNKNDRQTNMKYYYEELKIS